MKLVAKPCPCGFKGQSGRGCQKWIVEPLFYSVDAGLSKEDADELVRRWNSFERAPETQEAGQK